MFLRVDIFVNFNQINVHFHGPSQVRHFCSRKSVTSLSLGAQTRLVKLPDTQFPFSAAFVTGYLILSLSILCTPSEHKPSRKLLQPILAWASLVTSNHVFPASFTSSCVVRSPCPQWPCPSLFSLEMSRSRTYSGVLFLNGLSLICPVFKPSKSVKIKTLLEVLFQPKSDSYWSVSFRTYHFLSSNCQVVRADFLCCYFETS